MENLVAIIYLVSSVMFIIGVKMLTRVQTARRGNQVSSSAMLLAIVATLIEMGKVDYKFIIAGLILGAGIGATMAIRVQMTGMPEMVAIFNGLGGGASALVAASYLFRHGFNSDGLAAKAGAVAEKLGASGVTDRLLPELMGTDTTVTLFLSVLIGCITFTGSLIAFGKLKGLISGNPVVFPGQHAINLIMALGIVGLVGFLMVAARGDQTIMMASMAVIVVSLILGILLVIPIGGADMPVVISLLNSYSGVAAATTGFVLQSNVLIISGALVGASGLILTQIMCKAMNRSLANVLFGGFGQEGAATGGKKDDAYHSVKSCSSEEAAMIFESARDVIIVPGYGLAVAQAQHVTKELADNLIKNGARVRYAIHPVAGRMPGHMNVLLAESNVPHDQLFDLDQINDDFKNADCVLILGANDVVNPAAVKEQDSPIYGMPVLKVWEAQSVFVVKRSLSPGFAAIPNDLFNYENNLMLFGDAKKILTELNHEVKELVG